MPDGEPVQGLGDGAAAVHARLRPGVRPRRAQGDDDGPGRPRAPLPRARRDAGLAGPGRGIRPLPWRQRRGLGLRPAPEAAAPRRLPVRARPDSYPALRGGGPRTVSAYNFAFLDEQTKRMIRRAILKAVAIPGYQVPFGSREMPLSYGWGT